MPDPDLEIRGGEWSSKTLDKGGTVSKKIFFGQVWFKIKGGKAPRPLPWSATAFTSIIYRDVYLTKILTNLT